METPWVAVSEVCHLYGVSYATAKNQIYAGRFPVPVYKVGKLWVIDREVHAAFFAAHRQTGLQQITTKG